MIKMKPPKRRIQKNGIPLSDAENERFLNLLKERGLSEPVRKLLEETSLYVRGRIDGPLRTGTEPCGYVFISKGSFDLGHSAILHIDPNPPHTLLEVSFRRWKGILPFDAVNWDSLRIDRAQKNMRSLAISQLNQNALGSQLQKAISLATTARDTFSEFFDLSIDLLATAKQREKR